MKIVVTITTEGEVNEEQIKTQLVIARSSKPVPAAKVLLALAQLNEIGYKLLEEKALTQLPNGASMDKIKAALNGVTMADIMWPQQEQSEN